MSRPVSDRLLMLAARLAAAAVAGGLSVALVPSLASADSIFFLRNNNIWAATSNGGGQSQVTSDGNANPYVYVSSAKLGTAPLLGFHRATLNASGNANNVFGTMRPDGSGAAALPPDPGLASDAGTPVDTILDAVGSRLAIAKAFFGGPPDFRDDYDAASASLDGSDVKVARAATAIDTTFGDPQGTTLLYADAVSNDYASAPSACTMSTFGLARTAPVPYPDAPAPTPQAFYCVPGLELVQPTLRSDGSMIAAAGSASLASGATHRIFTLPIAGVATDGTPSPATPITPGGLDAQRPDFSPDGSQIAFQGPNNTVYTVPAAGGTPIKILDNAQVPAWSPYTPASTPGPGSQPGSPTGPGSQPGSPTGPGSQPGSPTGPGSHPEGPASWPKPNRCTTKRGSRHHPGAHPCTPSQGHHKHHTHHKHHKDHR